MLETVSKEARWLLHSLWEQWAIEDSYGRFWCLGKSMRSKKATAGGGKDAWDAPACVFPCSASYPAAFQRAARPAVSRWVALEWTAVG